MALQVELMLALSTNADDFTSSAACLLGRSATDALVRRCCPDHAAEADVAGRGVDGLALARGGAIAQAVVRGAEVGAPLDDPPWDVLARLSGGVTLAGGLHPGVLGR